MTVVGQSNLSASGLRRILFENGLSLTVFVLFLACWTGQILTGRHVYNQERLETGHPEVALTEYLQTGHFIEATGENWESEFLQMAAFVWLTSFLVQKGSPESNSPDGPEPDPPVTDESPWLARRGGWVRMLYGNSLTLALIVLFAISFVLHAWGGRMELNDERIAHGESPVSLMSFLASSEFWFQSMQNWQSEFLSIGMMVVLAIFLRQKGSPESKAVTTPHWQNE